MLGEKNLQDARQEAIRLRPWYGPFLTRLVFVKRETPQPLFHDVYGRVYYNDGYASFAKVETLAVLLIQIAEMFTRGLQWRRMGRDMQLWSFACLLDTASSMKKQGLNLPRESLKPEWFRFPRNKPAEYYYDRLLNLERISIPFTAIDDRGKPVRVQVEVYWEDNKLHFSMPDYAVVGGISDPAQSLEGLGFLLDPLLFTGIQEEVFNLAAEFGVNFAGDMPDWLVTQAEPDKSILPWHEHIRRFVGEQLESGNSSHASVWTMPSLLRPILPKGTRLPYYQGRNPNMALVFDTSGSMNYDRLSYALGEVNGILRYLQIDDGLTVIPTDATAHVVQNVYRADQIVIEGRGGTNIGKGLEKASELTPRPEGVIALTDGYTSWPESSPGNLPVLVVIVSEEWPKPSEKERWPIPEWAQVVEMFPWKGAA